MSFLQHNSRLVKSVISLFGTVFLATMFLSLFQMSSGMDMTSGMTDCPLMLDQSVVCQMDVNDHVSAWKSLFLAITPVFLLLLVAVGAVTFVLARAPNLFKRSLLLHTLLYDRVVERPLTFSYRALQELFSSGILHPKLYNVTLS